MWGCSFGKVQEYDGLVQRNRAGQVQLADGQNRGH